MTDEEMAAELLRRVKVAQARYTSRKLESNPDIRTQIARKVLDECKRDYPDIPAVNWAKAAERLM